MLKYVRLLAFLVVLVPSFFGPVVVGHYAYAANDSQSQQSTGDSGADNGMFQALIKSGSTIFYDLRELVYVVAGFGIIAVGIGGIFGNLNWKWLGAIIVALVVIATAGELIQVISGAQSPVGNTAESMRE